MTSITEHQLFVSSCYSTYLDLPINEQLTDIVTSLKESVESNQFSNQGGWQSKPYQFSDVDNIVIMDLFAKVITPMAQKIIDSWNYPVELSSYSYWYNANQKYNYNTNHSHPESYISGVYYIKVPSNSGNIVFSRAESETERMYFQTKEIMDKSLSVNDSRVNTEHWFTPKEGMLLLFPGHLKHTVEQNLSEEIDSTRISMSFNFNN